MRAAFDSLCRIASTDAMGQTTSSLHSPIFMILTTQVRLLLNPSDVFSHAWSDAIDMPLFAAVGPISR